MTKKQAAEVAAEIEEMDGGEEGEDGGVEESAAAEDAPAEKKASKKSKSKKADKGKSKSGKKSKAKAGKKESKAKPKKAKGNGAAKVKVSSKDAAAAEAFARKVMKDYGAVTVVRAVAQKYPDIKRAELLSILVDKVGINRFTASRQFHAARSGEVEIDLASL